MPPTLPPEVQYRILCFHPQPDQLWKNGRRVCRAWRSEVSKIFAKSVLPTAMALYLDCTGPRDDHVFLPMTFDRVDANDPTRCIFVEIPSNVAHEWHANRSSNVERFTREEFSAHKWACAMDSFARRLSPSRMCGESTETET